RSLSNARRHGLNRTPPNRGFRQHTRILLAGILLLLSPAVLAQTLPERAQQELEQLPTTTQNVIRKLSTLDHLPQTQLRIHPPDMPHGEAVDLDDSSWEEVKVPAENPKNALWYRTRIEVPQTVHGLDVTGARIWFEFNVDADGLGPEIVYLNGRRVAMGEDLEPIVLFENAKPGDRVLVAVKLTSTQDRKHFQGAELRMEVPAGNPDPQRLWKEIFAAGLLAPSLRSNAPGVMAQVEAASAAVDLEAFDRGDQQAFGASINKAESALAPANELLKKLSVRATGNSHIDAAWLWPWTETVDVVHRTFGTALQLMHEYPQMHYAQSAAQYSEWMEQKYPSLFQQMVERANEKRWELVGGMWVEPDLNMPDGE